MARHAVWNDENRLLRYFWIIEYEISDVLQWNAAFLYRIEHLLLFSWMCEIGNLGLLMQQIETSQSTIRDINYSCKLNGWEVQDGRSKQSNGEKPM